MTDKMVEEHFQQYRKMVDKLLHSNAREALIFWADWQEVTGRLLLLTGKNREYAEWKLEDARQRRAEAHKIKERSKQKR